jgi:hypothetical protein
VKTGRKEGDTESDYSNDFENDSEFEDLDLPQGGVEIDLEKFRKRAGLGNQELREALLKKDEGLKYEDEKLQGSERKDKKQKKKTIAVWTHQEDALLLEMHAQHGNQWKEIQKLFPEKSKE